MPPSVFTGMIALPLTDRIMLTVAFLLPFATVLLTVLAGYYLGKIADKYFEWQERRE